MNYFRCTVGGSGKGNTVTVTCAEEFAGLTITLAKTGKTYTKTCPSTAPYVVTYYGVENGTYTVSCTLDGETYSETVVVQDISCVLNYGFKWQTWVDTASQLDSSDYDTLDEVLADEKALRELFLEHACVDYMAESTASNEDLETIINNDLCAKRINLSDYALDFLGANAVIKALMDTADKYGYGEWVITDDTTTPPTWGPKGNVPIMTSTTAPYGTVIDFRHDNQNRDLPYHAFDGNPSTYGTNMNNRNTSDYFGYVFVNPVCPKRVYIAKHQDKLTDAAHLIVKGSNNNGQTWDVLSADIDISNVQEKYVDIDTNTYYQTLAVFNNDTSSSSYFALATIQFYGRELKVSVPTMTSNTAPFGVVSADSEQSSNPAWKAFDKDASTIWAINSSGATGIIGYTFSLKTVVKMFSFTTRNSSARRTPTSFKLQGSNDGFNNDVHDIEAYTNSEHTIKTYVFDSANDDDYSSYRLAILDSLLESGAASTTGLSLAEVQFYGLDYSEKEFEEGTTKKWLYDHGVELEELDTYYANNVPHGTVTKNASSMILDATSGGFVGVGTEIDLTAYTRAYTKMNILSEYSSGNGSKGIRVGSLSSGSVISNDAEVGIKIWNPYQLAVLDISNFNQVKAICSRTYTGKCTLFELWLE